MIDDLFLSLEKWVIIIVFINKRNFFSKARPLPNMFNRRDKIIKKAGEKPTDLEEEVAKSLGQLKADDKAQEQHLNIIFINSVSNVEYEQADGSSAQYLLVRIPHRSHGAFKKVGALVQEHLENKYHKPVIVVANRTIISPGCKYLSSFFPMECFSAFSTSTHFCFL